MAEIIEGVSHLNTKELYQILKDPDQADVQIIDVREQEEYEAGHIPGVPLIPMSEIPDKIEQFDKNVEYIFVCRSGRRSLEVAKFFQSEGIEKVHNYAGGMLDWKEENQEIVKGSEIGKR